MRICVCEHSGQSHETIRKRVDQVRTGRDLPRDVSIAARHLEHTRVFERMMRWFLWRIVRFLDTGSWF